jgi:hypothetical protein
VPVLRRRVPELGRPAAEILRRAAATRRAVRPASALRGPAPPVREPARRPRAITARRLVPSPPVTSPQRATRPQATSPPQRRRRRSELLRPVAERPGVVAPAGPGARARQKQPVTTQVAAPQVAVRRLAATRVAETLAGKMRPTVLAAQLQRPAGRRHQQPSSRRSSSSSPRTSPQPVRRSPPRSRNGSRQPGQGPMTTQRTAAAAMTARRARRAGDGAVAAAAEARALAPTRARGLMALRSQARRIRGPTRLARTPASPTMMAGARRLALRSAAVAVAALARVPKPTLTGSRLDPMIRRTPSSTSGRRARRAPTSTMSGP